MVKKTRVVADDGTVVWIYGKKTPAAARL